MERITIFDNDMPEIKLHSRTATQGEEYELVKQFIEYYVSQFLKYDKGNNLAIFIEPKVASGFPDIVFASYSPAILSNWSDARKELETIELKVLSFVLMKKGISGTAIMSALQLPEKQVLCSLEKLLDANLIVRKKKAWYPNEMKAVYSVERLESVEAKVADLNRVVEQSFINTWFASHSYAVTSIANPHTSTVRKFTDNGIGLYCKLDKFEKVVEAKKLSLPSSYLSLQFNEWIGNAFAN